MKCFAERRKSGTVEIVPVTPDNLADALKQLPRSVGTWVETHGFEGKPASHFAAPVDGDGNLVVVAGVDGNDDIWSWGGLAAALPEGRYALPDDMDEGAATKAALGWALGSYRFDRYRKSDRKPCELVWPKGADRAAVKRDAAAISLVRDLVNTPASDMGPADLSTAAKKLAKEFDAKFKEVVGDELLEKNFPMIHAVGRASATPPRLIDMTWGKAKDPKITLVGKGVCFDSGGLDLKPSSAMLLMKKDMGGSAQALGLARMIMEAGLPVRLRVLIPAVENAVSGNAFRPMDILNSRKGITVEIGNTDAEGRLVLGDALALACEEKPDLLIDFATLTGAARVALGTDMPAMFTPSDALAGELTAASAAVRDPLWRLPLHDDYRRMLDSKIADINNAGSGPYAGSITAALFLKEFVAEEIEWAHFDLMAWNLSTRPGRPEGGEAQAIRAVFETIRKRYE